MRKIYLLIFIVFSLLLTGCNLLSYNTEDLNKWREEDLPRNIKIEIKASKDNVVVPINTKEMINYSILINNKVQDNSDFNVVIKSSDTGIVDVIDGELVPVNIGNAYIEIYLSKKPEVFTTFQVKVVNPLNVYCEKSELLVGEEIEIFLENYLYNSDIIYQSSNPEVLHINQYKHAVGLKKGVADIIVTSKEHGTTASFTITVKTVQITKILIKNEQYSMKLGQEIKFDATILPSNANQKIIWTSSNPNVASIDESGKLITLSVGETRITATSVEDDTQYRSFLLRVYLPEIESINIDYGSETVYVGDEFKYNVTVFPTEAKYEIIFFSSHPDIATVDKNGNVKVLKEGYFLIGGTFKEKKDRCFSSMFISREVTNDVAIYNIPINIYYNVNSKQQIQLKAKIYPLDGNQEVIWSSSNKDIATINSFGIVTIHDIGVFKIKAVSNDDESKFIEIELNVEKSESSVLEAVTPISLSIGSSFQFNIYSDKVDITESFEFISLTPDLISFSELGLCTAKTKGDAYIMFYSKKYNQRYLYYINIK